MHHPVMRTQHGIIGKQRAHRISAAIIDVEAVPRDQLADLRFGLEPRDARLKTGALAGPLIRHEDVLSLPRTACLQALLRTMIPGLGLKTIMNVWKVAGGHGFGPVVHRSGQMHGGDAPFAGLDTAVYAARAVDGAGVTGTLPASLKKHTCLLAKCAPGVILAATPH